jgi:hypothetical protein
LELFRPHVHSFSQGDCPLNVFDFLGTSLLSCWAHNFQDPRTAMSN